MAPTSLRIPKGVVRILLAFVFFLAFLITPYWRHAETTPKMILVLALTILTGAVWLFVSAEDLQISLDASRWPFPAILSLLILLINLRPFPSVIPWRGDEDYHIENTLFLASQISTKWLLALGVIVLALLFLAWRKAKWALVAGALARKSSPMPMFLTTRTRRCATFPPIGSARRTRVAAICAFLCSPAARYINGADPIADGGYSLETWTPMLDPEV